LTIKYNFEKDVAVVGISGRFPKADDISVFWENLLKNRECLSEFAKEDLFSLGVIDKYLLDNQDYIPVKGYIERATYFAADLFKISEKKALIMDPQFRLFIESVYHTLVDAGYNPNAVDAKVGVYASSGSEDTYYLKNLFNNPKILDSTDSYELLINNGKDFLATIVAYCFDFTGPCENIQTACSSSLVAICNACDSLRNKKCDIAIAGGFSLSFPLEQGYLYKPGMIYSNDGHCKAFSENATGIVRGNGGGTVCLKLLKNALKDGDLIYTIIKGYAVNNDGRNKLSYTAPSVRGQYDVLSLAAEDAGIKSCDIDYIEGHGTGTKLGDKIEVTAISRFLEDTKKMRNSPCLIGSVKANIGHLDVAAGIASFIKASLSMAHKVIPKSLFTETANSSLFDDYFLVPASSNVKLVLDKNYYFGISSFGVGGTNAHIVITNAEDKINKTLTPIVDLENRINYLIDPPNKKQMLESVKSYNKTHKFYEPLFACKFKIDDKIVAKNYEIKQMIIRQDEADCYKYILTHFAGLEELNITVIAKPDGKFAIDDKWLQERTKVWERLLLQQNQQETLYLINIDFFMDESRDLVQITHFYDYVALAKALTKISYMGKIAIFCIANGIFKIIDSDKLHLDASAIMGPIQCLPCEFPNVSTILLDVKYGSVKSTIHSLEKELAYNDYISRFIGYRDNKRYIPYVAKLEDEAPDYAAIKLKHNGVYIITGGLGGIGLTLAEHIANTHQVNFFLIHHTRFPSKEQWEVILNDNNATVELKEKIILLQEIDRKSSSVHLINVDIADSVAVNKTFTQIKSNFANIDGVIHAASTYPQGLIANKPVSLVKKMLAIKITGLHNIVDNLQECDVQFVLLCSALSIYTGAAGATDYVAANYYCNVYAECAKENLPYPVLTISWDLWQSTGMRFRAQQSKKFSLSNKIWQDLIVEHIIDGKYVVPGSVLVDMFLQYLTTGGNRALPLALESVSFVHLAAFDSFVQSGLEVAQNGAAIKVFDEHKSYCQAMYKTRQFCVKSIYSKPLFDKLFAAERMILDIGNEKKLVLGVHWRCLDWVTKVDNYFLARLSLNKSYHRELEDYILHPVLLDVGYSFHVNTYVGQFLPFYMQNITVISRLPVEFYSLVRVTSIDLDTGVCNCDVTLISINFDPLVEVSGFVLKRL
jgi:3-oxoacyl-(acyl-carrier-protein) synthase